jgi:hypothetical protein
MTTENTHDQTAAAAERETWPRWRVWTIRIWYGLLTLWALSMSRGVVELALGQAAPGERFGYGAVTAWKLLALGGVFWVCWTAGRSVVAFQALLVGWIGWLISERLYAVAPAGDNPISAAIATVILWLLPLALLRPHRRQLLHLDLRPGAILLPLALAAAVPLSIYAVRQGDLATGPANFAKVYYSACSLGAVLALQALFAALRPAGGRWLPRYVALAAAWIGVLAVIWPHDLTSPGRAWGAALVGWALLFAAGAEVEAKRDPTTVPGAPNQRRNTPQSSIGTVRTADPPYTTS